MHGAVWSAVGVAAWVLMATRADAHGIVGQRMFIEPFVTEDVNPKNEFVVLRPEWDDGPDGRTLSLGFGLEKTLADRFSVALASAWNETGIGGSAPRAGGFDNLDVSFKYAFWMSPRHEAIAAAAVDAAAPTGATAAGAARDWSFTPLFLYGKGFGDLPDAVAYLRPLAVQGDAGPQLALDAERSTTLAHDVAVEYSVPYLQAAVRDLGLRGPLADLVAVTEFNFTHGLHGAAAGETRVVATPGIVYLGRYVELGVAGRLPLNDGARRTLRWGMIGIVDLFLDDVLSATRWQPCGGMS